MTTEFQFVARDGCPRDNCTYELNPDCCGEETREEEDNEREEMSHAELVQ